MTSELLPAAVEMVSKAREGEILISAHAKNAVESRATIRLEPIGKQLELEIDGKEQTPQDLYEVIGLTTVTLNDRERAYLFAQDPKSRGGGGFSSVLGWDATKS